MARIKKQLQGDWASTDGKLKGNKTNSKVTDELVREIGDLSVSETEEQLRQEFDETKVLLDIDAPTSYQVPVRGVELPDGFNENEVCALLAKPVENPTSTGQESMILQMIKNGRQSFVEAAKNDFSDESTTVCRYCLREIDDEYRRSLINSINKVLNKDVDIHKDELLAISFPEFEQDYSNFTDLDVELVRKIQGYIENCKKL